MNARIGNGKAVHLIGTGDKPVCGKSGELHDASDQDVTCKAHMKLTADPATAPAPAPKPNRRSLSAARADEAEPVVPAAPVPAPKPKAKRKAPKPRATKAAGTTKLFASDKNIDAFHIPGARWAAVVRATGALTASVNCAEYGLIDASDRWMALCVTHDEHEFHATHRDAWNARRRPQDWCGGCAAIVAGDDA
ncbi:hypothetical protein [Actinacidiphila glaucinigra]|uniref:hypothetical protein n=1 Tax=Actinacidiphila glaucinigra TaxID=235986 RepID=UPI002E329810|nr:hypothetical protein [Actinacidiphila glaucinigra]